MLGSAMAVIQHKSGPKEKFMRTYVAAMLISMAFITPAMAAIRPAADHGSQAAFNLSDRSAGAGNEGGGAPPRQ